MLADFHIITITHQDLNVNEIGNFIVCHNDKEDLSQKLKKLMDQFEIKEMIYLSTCNRLTFITYDYNVWEQEKIKQFFKAVNPELDDVKLRRLPKFVRLYSGESAIAHLFEVCSSIDSLVIGEREIFRQFRNAYHFSKDSGLIGDNLRLLEKYTVQAAKKVYAQTKIGERAISIVSLAIQKLINSDFRKDSRIIMIGAGETNTKVARFLHKYGFTNAVVFNRNLNNADEIRKLLNAEAYHLRDLEHYKKGFDILIVCTGATAAIIDVTLYKKLLGEDESRKLVMDLSIPHNVEKAVIENFEPHHINIEQLRKLAEENHDYRKDEVVKAKSILKNELKEFVLIYQQRIIERAMGSVPQEIKNIKKKAVDSIFYKDLQLLDNNVRNLVLEMMDYMEKKCISVPMKLAKKSLKDK